MRLPRTLVLVTVVAVSAATVGMASARRQAATSADAATLTATAHRDADHALRGEVRVSTAGAAVPVVVEAVADDGHTLRVTPDAPVEDGGAVPLLGLRPGRTYDVTVEAPDTRVDAGSIGTRTLPDSVPPVQAPVPGDPDGVTLFGTLYLAPEGDAPIEDTGAVVAVDGTGEVVWYEAMPLGTEDVTATSRGTLLVTYHEMGIREIDPAEGVVREWVGTSARDADGPDGRPVARPGAIEVDTDQMHHEVIELPNGNLLTLSREVREVTYPEPICDGAGRTEQVAADTLVEFAPDTGAVVRELSLFDVLDPTSPEAIDQITPSEFCSPYLDPRYPQGDVRDWTHANGIEIDPDRNVVWISARHLDQLVGLRWLDDDRGSAGELVHLLGEGGTLELEGDGEWFLHQHAPELQPDGSLLIYDNGNWREGTDVEDPDNLPYSRAVSYDLDLDAGTATQVWEHRFPQSDGVYAPYVGDADTLEDGRVLIAHGGLLDPPSESPNDPGVLRWGRIVEVDPATGEVVWDVRTRDPDGQTGWGLYRAERLAHLYPPGWAVEVSD